MTAFQKMLNTLQKVFPHGRHDEIIVGVEYAEAPHIDDEILNKYYDENILSFHIEDCFVWIRDKRNSNHIVRYRWKYPFLIKFIFADEN